MRSMEPSARTKSMPTTLEWLCPPNLLTAHQSDKFVDLHVQFVKYVVLRRGDPRLRKASCGKLTSLNFDVVKSVVSRPVEILDLPRMKRILSSWRSTSFHEESIQNRLN